MLKYIARRILHAIPMLLVISVITFTLIQIAPFDVVDTFTTPKMSPETKEALKARYGLDKPPYVQYFNWLANTVRGDLGYSIVNHQSVAEALAARLPNTIILVLPSYALAVFLSIIIGVKAGSNMDGPFDRAVAALCSVGMATPTFWVGMILLYVFAYLLAMLPVLGMHTLGQESNLPDLIRHMILPCTVLTLAFLPETIRYVRAASITQYKEDYVMVQRAYGASKAEILFRHVAKNVMLPVITLVGMSLPTLITGAFITESIFSWPGVGTYFLNAIRAFDYPVVMTVLLFSSAAVITGNLLADVGYCLLDPRIKEGQS
jgi:peptide/nickel transport system permease protein